MANAICLKTTSGPQTKNQELDSQYTRRSSKTELHIADTVLDRILAAWRNSRRLVVKLTRLQVKKGAGRASALTYVPSKSRRTRSAQIGFTFCRAWSELCECMDGSQDFGVLQSAGCHPTTSDSETSEDLRLAAASLQKARWFSAAPTEDGNFLRGFPDHGQYRKLLSHCRQKE